ncbi:MAG: TIGR03576 family pyridoxal phosphate-dependent enzyme [Methanobacterium sp.]|uniref:TIGR03576 family pyridoxal phosphate-dependent enzyme n=1 Tax=Methanobacterium sp. TaxID=2164 RepID=UPI003D650DA0|nr:TIGR03576 family pyridoxal phosphate-dependent enzyme [Methanobacterium sp.]
MLINSSVDEVKKRENSLKIIDSIIKNHGRNALYDLTGLAGGFKLNPQDMDFLETYAGPAMFENELQRLGTDYLGGEKVFAFNRTTSGILATILALVKPGDEVIHYLPKFPSHPSIPRSTKLVGASYKEFDNINDFEVQNNTALVIITGSTMDHDILEEEEFFKIIDISKSKNIPVFVDDASGARLRTVLYKQPKAMDMGADIVITSTDKLMNGPRAGLMAGKKEIIDLIKSKAHEFGLEAQTATIVGIIRAIENFSGKRMIRAFKDKHEIYEALKKDIESVRETPTGVMISADDIIAELKKKGVKTDFTSDDVACVFAALLLRNYHILTIPAVGMPGASATLRIDLAASDSERIDNEYIVKAMIETFSHLSEIVNYKMACKLILYENDISK